MKEPEQIIIVGKRKEDIVLDLIEEEEDLK